MGGGRRARQAIEARRRARRRLLALGATLVVLAVIGTALAIVANREPPADPAARPKEFVAIRDSVVIEVRTVEDNRLVRTVVDMGPKEAPKAQLGDLTVPDDRSTAYFVQADEEGLTVKRVRLDASTPSTVAAGSNPAITKDGRRLAYLAPDASALVVRDMRTGEERKWTPTPEVDLPDRTTLLDYAMSWSPDGRHLAFALIQPDEVFLLDTRGSGTTLAAAKRIGPPGEAGAEAWAQPVFQPSGKLAVLKTCCDESLDYPLLIVDPATGDVTRTERSIDHEVTRFDYSQAGSHLIYVTPIDEAYRATGDGEQHLVGKGISSVAW